MKLSIRQRIPLSPLSLSWAEHLSGVQVGNSPLSPSFRYSLFPLTRVFFPEELDMGPPPSPGEYFISFPFMLPFLSSPSLWKLPVKDPS